MVFGEQSFDRVTKFLQADTQRVPWLRFVAAQCVRMQLLDFFEALPGQALRGQAADGDETHTPAQAPLQALPFLVVKLLRDAKQFVAQFRLIGFEQIAHMGAHRIFRGGKSFYPVLHHVPVAQRSQRSKKFPGGIAHSRPGLVRIDFFKNLGHRTAPADRHAQIMYIICVRLGAHSLQFSPHPFHGVEKLAVLYPGPGSGMTFGMRRNSGDASHRIRSSTLKFGWKCRAKRTYRVALRCSVVQSSAWLHNSGSMRSKTPPISNVIAPAIRKTRDGFGCPRRSIANCATGCSATPRNESRLATAMVRPFSVAAGRRWMSALMGTTKNPPANPSAARYASTVANPIPGQESSAASTMIPAKPGSTIPS